MERKNSNFSCKLKNISELRLKSFGESNQGRCHKSRLDSKIPGWVCRHTYAISNSKCMWSIAYLTEGKLHTPPFPRAKLRIQNISSPEKIQRKITSSPMPFRSAATPVECYNCCSDIHCIINYSIKSLILQHHHLC